MNTVGFEKNTMNSLLLVRERDEDALFGELYFEIEDDIMWIRSVEEFEGYKGTGVATRMYDFAEDYARKQGAKGAVMTAVIPENERRGFVRFAIRNDFDLPTFNEKLITVDLYGPKSKVFEKMSKSENNVLDQTCKMLRLPSHLENYYQTQIRPKIPKMLTREEHRGRIIPEVSLAYVRDDIISAYVVFTDINGMFYLDSIYVDKNYQTDLMWLLLECIKEARRRFPNYDKLLINTVKYDGYKLASKLSTGMDTTVELVTTLHKVF